MARTLLLAAFLLVAPAAAFAQTAQTPTDVTVGQPAPAANKQEAAAIVTRPQNETPLELEAPIVTEGPVGAPPAPTATNADSD